MNVKTNIYANCVYVQSISLISSVYFFIFLVKERYYQLNFDFIERGYICILTVLVTMLISNIRATKMHFIVVNFTISWVGFKNAQEFEEKLQISHYI